jgi:zinc finger SWIM domain-containing protein 3
MDSMLKRHGGYDKVGFTARDLYNFCHRNKLQMLSGGDAQTIINYLIAQKHRDPQTQISISTTREMGEGI